MAQQQPRIGRRVHYLDGTIHLTADICAVYLDQVVDLFVKDQVLGVTYFRYAVPFDAAVDGAARWGGLPLGLGPRARPDSAPRRAWGWAVGTAT